MVDETQPERRNVANGGACPHQCKPGSNLGGGDFQRGPALPARTIFVLTSWRQVAAGRPLARRDFVDGPIPHGFLSSVG